MRNRIFASFISISLWIVMCSCNATPESSMDHTSPSSPSTHTTSSDSTSSHVTDVDDESLTESSSMSSLTQVPVESKTTLPKEINSTSKRLSTTSSTGSASSAANSFSTASSSSNSTSSTGPTVNFEWKIVDNKAQLIRYTGTAKEVTIPAEYNGRPVEVICGDSFRSTPAEIVNTPDTLKTIDRGAFGVSKIKVLNISKSVRTIGEFLFENTNAIEAVNVDSGNTYFCSESGILFNKNKTILMYYPNRKAGVSYTIPNTVQGIDIGAFSQNWMLQSISVPASVIYIAWGAMSNWTALTAIKFEGDAPYVPSAPFNGTYNATIYYHAGTIGWTNPWNGLSTARY